MTTMMMMMMMMMILFLSPRREREREREHRRNDDGNEYRLHSPTRAKRPSSSRRATEESASVTKEFDESFFQFVLIDYYILFSFFFIWTFFRLFLPFPPKATQRKTRQHRATTEYYATPTTQKERKKANNTNHGATLPTTARRIKKHSHLRKRTLQKNVAPFFFSE